MVHTYEGEGLNEIHYSVRNDVLTSNYTQYSDNRMGKDDQGAHFTDYGDTYGVCHEWR